MRDYMHLSPGKDPRWRDRLLAIYRRKGWRGFTRIYDLLKPAAGRRQIQIITRYGTQFLVVPWDSVDSHVLVEGFYESEVLEALRPDLNQPDAVLWVVGANFGLHAITAKHLHPKARVVAFEPSPSMAARLIENCDLNKVTVELHAYALAEKCELLEFHANASGNPGMSTLHPCPEFNYDHHFHVATMSASDVLAKGRAPAPSALLVDAEGSETDVLSGFGAALYAPSLRRIVFEAPNDFLINRIPLALHALLEGAGFKITRLERCENTAHSLSNFLAFRS